jgi:hybrid cluster-associated redox disulfide protein
MVVNKDMSIIQVLNMDRGTAGILMQFGMHCLGCPHATMESLEGACAAHGTDVNKLVKLLNEYFANKESK